VSCASLQAVSRWGGGLMLKRSALRADSAAVLGFGRCRTTHFAHCVRSVQTGCGMSVVEAREYARPTKPCAPRRFKNRPPPNRLTAFRSTTVVLCPSTNALARKGVLGLAAAGRVKRRGAQGFRPRAYSRASTTDSPQVFERSERSERSEFCGGPKARAPQGSREATASVGALRPARARLCRAET
jgi:hypothetical protein